MKYSTLSTSCCVDFFIRICWGIFFKIVLSSFNLNVFFSTRNLHHVIIGDPDKSLNGAYQLLEESDHLPETFCADSCVYIKVKIKIVN